MENTTRTYDVIDTQTGLAINAKPMTSRNRAYNKATREDLKYGASRYTVRINWESNS